MNKPLTYPFPVGEPGFDLPPLADFFALEVYGQEDVAKAASLGIVLKLEPAEGEESRITIYHRNGAKRKNLQLVLGPKSSGNVFVMDQPSGFSGTIQIFGARCSIIDLGDKDKLSVVRLTLRSDECFVYWGKNCTSNGVYSELSTDGRQIVVGEDCNFASEIIIRPTDMHAVVDLSSGEKVNDATGPIVFFPHVWVGQRAAILKNVVIGPGCIVGAGAVVTRSIEPLKAVAGNPAKVVRSNFSWTRPQYPNKNQIAQLKADLDCFTESYLTQIKRLS